MFQDQFVFSQLVRFLDRNRFNYLVKKYDGDKYVKHFTCWNQLLVLIFGQLCNRESLRDLIVALDAHRTKCYHLGFGRKPIAKTTLSSANQIRDYRIFEEFAFSLMNLARQKRATKIFQLDGHVYAFDSTTIPLCLSVFWWAKFRKHNGGVPAFFHITTASVHDSKVMKEIPYEIGAYYVFDRGYNAFKELYRIHQCNSFFIIRAKENLKFSKRKWKRRLPQNILTDAEIELSDLSSTKYPELLRLVRFYDQEQKREFLFLTNAMHLKALDIANLYKNRWQVELFFKWLKQHLKIKRFWGTTENAVRIQISAAITAYCMVAIAQHDLRLNRSTYEVLQILSISLTDKTPLSQLFKKATEQNEFEDDSLNLFGPEF